MALEHIAALILPPPPPPVFLGVIDICDKGFCFVLVVVLIFFFLSFNAISSGGGGSPMSHVDCKKWSRPLSLFLQLLCQF